MTSAFIDISKAKNTQDAANTLIALKLKIEKALDAVMHTVVEPNYRYIVNIILDDDSKSFNITQNEFSNLNNIFAENLALFDLDTKDKNIYIAESLPSGNQMVLGNIDWLIENKMLNNSLVLEDYIICYLDNVDNDYITLKKDVTIIVTKLSLTDSDIEEFRLKQMQEAMSNLHKLGYTVPDDGTFVIS